MMGAPEPGMAAAIAMMCLCGFTQVLDLLSLSTFLAANHACSGVSALRSHDPQTFNMSARPNLEKHAKSTASNRKSWKYGFC
jgi:hypothetical protein